jgi:endonuclease YncB( thermonuclease family)
MGFVREAIDGRTIQLADGREVVLAGIVAPSGKTDGASAAKAALHGLVASREIHLLRLGTGVGADTDRYGRLLALVVTGSDTAAETGASVQQAMLVRGQARVAARVGDRGCAAGLWAAERAARIAGLGLWSDPYYSVKNAASPGEILTQRGRFALVEGKVLSVRESGGTIYVNFGRRWSEDFTVTIAKRNEKSFIAAGMDLKKLAGQNVRVRGMIEERGGPWIEAARPEQIEIGD